MQGNETGPLNAHGSSDHETASQDIAETLTRLAHLMAQQAAPDFVWDTSPPTFDAAHRIELRSKFDV